LIELLGAARTSGHLKNGEISFPDERSFTAFVTPIQEDGFVAILHDVTHFKDLERVKNEFITTVSHDLRNPLSVIKGFTELLQRVGPLNQTQIDYTHRIYAAGENMNRLLQNLVELVKLDMGAGVEMKRGIVDLCELVSDVAAEFRPQAESRGQMLQVQKTEDPLRVEVDPPQLRRALSNLVDNAIKYTPNGGSITLSIGTQDRQAVFNVQDTGFGILPEDLPLVFNRLYRVRNNETRGIEGNGLGLAIVKSIVEQHGGQVNVESEYGKGSSFKISLPLNQL
jgi:two-component system phosphate regulon sensor histidine kinase PhoR